uniref:Uncharacterized protein n=1 Tax=Tetranychus urticae TaxID=32264 RepID=T1KP93_TETUR
MLKSHRVITNRVFNKKSNPKFINNQRTILGVLLSLMEGQKVAVALIHLRQSDESDLMIPIGFKIDEKNVPDGIKPMKFNPSNLVDLSVDGCKSINVMIVSLGDDSQELISIYAGFCAKLEKSASKVGKFDKKINHWINIESLKIEQKGQKVLQIVKREDFETFMNRVDILKRRERAKTGQETASTKPDDNVVDLDSTGSDESDDDSDYDGENSQRNSNKRDFSDRKASKRNSDRDAVQQSLEKIKNIISHPKADPAGRTFIAETFNILEFLVRQVDSLDSVEAYQSFSNDEDELRFLSEEDPTKEVGKKILIEGILPLPARKYKAAIKCKNPKQDELDFGPAAVITNLIKYTFPDHWIDNVTLRGSGGRVSLINIWNHCDPHQMPLQEPTEPGLGESRFRALLDHAVRISGRKSYDKSTEKILVSSLSKAMHYARSRLIAVKKSKCENFFELKENVKSKPKVDRIGKVVKGTLTIHPPTSTVSETKAKGTHHTQPKESNIFEVMMNHEASSEDEDEVSEIIKPKKNSNSHRISDDLENDESEPKPLNSVDFSNPSSEPNPEGQNSDSGIDLSSNSKTELDKNKTPVVVLPNLENFQEQQIQSESPGYADTESFPVENSPPASPLHTSTPKRKFDEIEDKKAEEEMKKEKKEKEEEEKEEEEKEEEEKEEDKDEIEVNKQDIPCEFEVKEVDDFEPLTQKIPGVVADDCDSQSTKNPESDDDLSEYERDLLSKLQNNRKLILDSFTVKPKHRPLDVYKSDDNLRSKIKKSKSAHLSTSASKNVEFPSGKKSFTQDSIESSESRSECFIVILPLVIDEKKRNSNQPILMSIDKKNFLDLGISEDQQWSQDDSSNLFNGYFKKKKISFRIIASGDTLTCLKASLSENIRQNNSWRFLKKIINYTSESVEIDRDETSLDDNEDLPFINMTYDELISIFQSPAEFKEKPAKATTTIEKCSSDKDSSNEIDMTNIISKNAEKDSSSKRDENQKTPSPSTSIHDNHGDFRVNLKSRIQTISNNISELKKKKCILSEIDSTGIILRSVIDTMDEMFSCFCEKNKIVKENLNVISSNDETFKVKSKNQICLEGKFPIRYDLYEKAMKLAKADNPCSIAYQLTRIAFPEHYYMNVTLGKRIFSYEELSDFKNCIVDKNPKEKIPLALVLSFENPLEKPFTGETDFDLGQARIDSYFDHIFRKAGFSKYSNEELSKVRSRIIRVLCQLNQEKHRNSKANVNEAHNSNDENSEEQWISDIMSSEIFQENEN